MKHRRPVLERLMEKVKKDPSGCWLFTGCKDGCGYGKIGVPPSGNNSRAHRVMYEHVIGPIPEGMLVLHSCDTPACVNPAHLVIGTDMDNSNDKILRGRVPKNSRGLPRNIYPHGNRYIVRASVNGKWTYLGSSATVNGALAIFNERVIRPRERRAASH